MSKSSTISARQSPPRDGRSAGGVFSIHAETFAIDTADRVELIDLTDRIAALVRGSNIADGLVSLWSMHTTFAVFMNEAQKALHADIKRLLETMVARDADWMHNDPDHSDCDRFNADAHLRAMLLGHSLTVQVSGGELVLGQWQRVLVAELDGPRSRTLRMQMMGIG